MKTLNNQCLLVLVWLTDCFSEDSYRDNYDEECKINSQCPDLMHCNKNNLCACDIGLSFSHSLSKCERAKKIFTDFDIRGPSEVNISVGKIGLQAVIGEKWKGLTWTYSWTILNGMDSAHFAGMDGPFLSLTELKVGCVQLTLSVSNDTSEGYMLRDIVIAEERDYSIKVVDCVQLTKAESVRLWLPRDNSLRLCTIVDKAVSYKWVRVDHSLQPVDISAFSGSTSSILELSSFQIVNETNPYEFILSVIFDNGHSSNATVKIFVRERPEIPVINAQNATVQLRADSVMLKAQISNESADVLKNFIWAQTEGPCRVHLVNRNSFSSASIVGPFNASGLYAFHARGETIAGDVSEAVLFINVLPEEAVQLSPNVLSSNFSVVLPKRFVFLQSNHCRSNDTFTWEPDGHVPAVMLLDSDFHSQQLFISHLFPGIFIFRIFCYGELANSSSIVRLEVKKGNETAHALFSLHAAIRREQTDDKTFLIHEQNNILKKMEKILQQNLGGHLMSNVDDILYDDITGILTLRLAIYWNPMIDIKMNIRMIEAKMATVLQEEKAFLAQFAIVSISPITKCSECAHDAFSMSFFSNIFSAEGEKSIWRMVYAWLSIFTVFVFFFKFLHFLWQYEEGERKITEKWEQYFCTIWRRIPTHKGRFSPIPPLRKSKESFVNKALLYETHGSLLDNEFSASECEEEEEEIHPTKPSNHSVNPSSIRLTLTRSN